jgi:hypothetical protein
MAINFFRNLANQRALFFKIFTIGHFSLSWFSKLTQNFGESINYYCMTSSLYIVLTLFFEVLFDSYNNRILKGCCLFLSALVTKIMPIGLVNTWSYGVTIVGVGYKIMEGSLLLNMSFKFSRKMRAKFEEEVTREAVILLCFAVGQFLLAILISWNIYMNLDLAKTFIKLMFVLQTCASAFIIVGTLSYAGNDCTVSNSTFYFLMSSFKLYTYFLFSSFINMKELNFMILLKEYFMRKSLKFNKIRPNSRFI